MDYSNICANTGCEETFTKKTHNQKYCCDRCCREATNRKIMERYYEDKQLRSGAPRQCATCSRTLSKYNLEKICSPCEAKAVSDEKQMLIEQLSVITWE